MEKHIKLNKQFLTFVSFIKDLALKPYEVRLINLILQNFEKIAVCGTAAGKRGYPSDRAQVQMNGEVIYVCR